MKITTREENGVCIIRPYGRIDASVYEEFNDAVREVLSCTHRVELDLEETLFVSSSGLRVIMAAAKACADGSFKLTHVSPTIMEVLDMTGLTDSIQIEPEPAFDAANVKVIFFDVDGTLLSHKQGIIPDSTKEAIRRAQERGVKAVICTGRDIIELDKLPIHDIDFDGFLTLNGNICLDQDRKMFAGNPIDRGELEVLVSIFEAGRLPFVLVGKDKRYINFVDDVVIKTQLATHGTIPDIGEYQGEEIYQCLAFVDSEVRQRLEETLDQCHITSWNDTGIDIIAKTGGKDAGIQKFLDREGVQRSQTMAFGDGENDAPMLSYVEMGVSMGNGVEKLKQIAGYVTTSVDDDGIKNALEHFGII